VADGDELGVGELEGDAPVDGEREGVGGRDGVGEVLCVLDGERELVGEPLGDGVQEPSGALILANGHAAAQPHAVGAVEFAAQKNPAGQPAHVAFVAEPTVADHAPAPHDVGAAAPMPHQNPAGQTPHAVGDDEPVLFEKVPGAHGVALNDANGQ